jgi:beta-lactamase class A
METLLFSPLKLGILLRLLYGVAILQSTLPTAADIDHTQTFLETIRPSPELQAFLDATVDELTQRDPWLSRCNFTVALLDLDAPGGPALAQTRGDVPVYPASVIKFVYLMAAFRWQEQGRLRIDRTMQRQLQLMIHDSSNQATQWVFYALTGTEPGPALRPADYLAFRDRRYGIKRWVQSLGVEDVHCIHPTYDGRMEIWGREAQLLSDHSIQDGGRGRDGFFFNRVQMTANAAVKLLALLATDRAMTPQNCAAVREMMRRDLRDQPHLMHRIAGGAARLPGMEVFSKSGTALNIYADVGIVRHVSGRQMALAVFVEAPPHGWYRGDFIADLTERCASRVLLQQTEEPRPLPGIFTLLPLQSIFGTGR